MRWATPFQTQFAKMPQTVTGWLDWLKPGPDLNDIWEISESENSVFWLSCYKSSVPKQEGRSKISQHRKQGFSGSTVSQQWYLKVTNTSLALWSNKFLILLICNDLQFCKWSVYDLCNVQMCSVADVQCADVLRRRNLYRQTGQWTSCSGATSRWTTCGFFMAVLHLDISKHSSTFFI